MKILMIVQSFPCAMMPNNGIWLVPFLDEIAKNNPVTLLVLEPLTKYLKPSNWIKIFRNNKTKFLYENPNVKIRPLLYFNLPKNILFKQLTFPLLQKRFEKLISRKSQLTDIDLIHSHFSSPAGTLARLLSKKINKPYVVTEHSGNFKYLLDHGVGVSQVINEAAHFISVSEFQLNEIKINIDLKNKNTSIIPMGLDFSRFKLPPDGPEINKSEKKWRLLFVGWLVKTKGCHILMESLNLLKNKGIKFELKIIGKGAESEHLHNASLAMGFNRDEIIFTGEVPNDQMPQYYENCDLYITPSFRESFGMSLVEALACGRPCVASKCGGPEYIMKDFCGTLCEKENINSLASAIEQTINKYDTYAPRKIRQYALDHFSKEQTALKVLEIYDKIQSTFK